MALNYNGGTTVSPSSVDKGGPNNAQLQSYCHLRKSLIEASKEQFFTKLADVTKMPKNFGKKIKVLDLVPILDDANDNDQGLDPSGAVIDNGKYTVRLSKLAYTFTGGSANANATAAANAANAWAGSNSWLLNPVLMQLRVQVIYMVLARIVVISTVSYLLYLRMVVE